MIQLIRIIVALFLVGLSGAYYLSCNLELSSAPQLLSFDEFQANKPLVDRHAVHFGLEDGAAAAVDLQAAYSRYLGDWGEETARPGLSQSFVSPLRLQLHRLYAAVGQRLPTPRTAREPAALSLPENRWQAGMIATAGGCCGLLVLLQCLSSWLRNLART